MITGGVKLTQSGGIALLNGNKLEFNIEIQKLDNNPRYSNVDDTRTLTRILSGFGYELSDVDEWVLDGWDGSAGGRFTTLNNGTPMEVLLAPYRETERVPNPLVPGYAGELLVGDKALPYKSYVHVGSHLAAAYCTSPFARRGEPSFVMVWDGGCFPRLYFVDENGLIEPCGEAFPLIGHTYSMASQHWGPFKRTNKSKNVDDLSVAGKLMAYIALGTARDEIKKIFHQTFHKHFEADTPSVREYREKIIGCGSTGEPSHGYVHAFLVDVAEQVRALGCSEDDVLASVHEFLEEMLLERVTAKIRAWKGDGPWNLCFAGGCALNIKWNSSLRAHPTIKAMWVPPFPDDSGSAIGTAVLHYGATQEGLQAIEWDTRMGPALVPTDAPLEGWTVAPCSTEELAGILHRTGQPVVLLNGRAELGPRALGARSIIAPANDPRTKDILNDAKKREHYRPVAPICLVEHAPEIFDPGTPDPHMLFEHRVRPDWVNRIPAILHLDGTARLQTVSERDDQHLAAILREYHRLSGIPVLCNTSANYNGRSFFPDAKSAMEWGQLDLVWADGMLYRKSTSSAD